MCKEKPVDSDCEVQDDMMRRGIQQSINDPGIDIAAAIVFDRIEALHAKLFSGPIASDEEQFIR